MYFGKESEGLDGKMGGVQWAMLMGSALIMIVGVVNLFGIESLAAVAAETLVR